MRKFQQEKNYYKNNRGSFWELENRIMGRKKRIMCGCLVRRLPLFLAATLINEWAPTRPEARGVSNACEQHSRRFRKLTGSDVRTDTHIYAQRAHTHVHTHTHTHTAPPFLSAVSDGHAGANTRP